MKHFTKLLQEKLFNLKGIFLKLVSRFFSYEGNDWKRSPILKSNNTKQTSTSRQTIKA